METGELTEEDVARQRAQQPPLASNYVAPSVTSGPASLPPMVGGNEQHSGEERHNPPCHYYVRFDTFYPSGPPLQRMVVGDSLPSPIMPPIQPEQRLVEGDNDIEVLHIQPPVLPPMPGLPAQPPPPGGREVEGESRPPGQSQPPLPREPIIDGESQPGPARPTVPGEFTFALGNYQFYIHN